MPLFDVKCPNCKAEWEALIVKSTDIYLLTCQKCGAGGEKQTGNKVAHTIFGFAARNGYGLKKFDDGR